MRDLNTTTGTIISVSMRIHTALGPGLFESVYVVLLECELRKLGFYVERQKSIGFEFAGHRFENAFVVDLLVENSVVVEVKSQEKLAPVHETASDVLATCNCKVGLLINFNEASLKNGIKRVVNRLEEPTPRTPLPRVPRVK